MVTKTSLATKMLYRRRRHIQGYPRGSSYRGARTSRRTPAATVAARLAMTRTLRGLSEGMSSALPDVIVVDDLLTREVHCKLAHVHARLYPRRPRS